MKKFEIYFKVCQRNCSFQLSKCSNGGGGGGVSRPSMSAYVLSFLDSMRQRTCFLGHWRT